MSPDAPRPRLVAILGPTAAGKSALGIALARHADGEIVACDSTAVFRGIDIGTDKVSAEEQQGVPHHLVDVADPTEIYSAARYAQDAAPLIRAITARGRLPIVVGGTGLYYRALVRGLFPGPARHEALRAALERLAAERGVGELYRWVRRLDPGSATRIQPRDSKRLVRALEVALVSGVPMTAHFADTVSPIADYDVLPIAVSLPAADTAARVARRVEQQFDRGVVDEVRGLLAAGVPRTAQALCGLVYRQVVEMLEGIRDEAATRELIVRENRHYARRQLIWFRKEPRLTWIDGPGETPAAMARAIELVNGFAPRI
ncbi:MAG: tRNA (adenosine(37)-N6)-dimethylallyltransferase MiaA [Vicinamibacteraceae bacterium]